MVEIGRPILGRRLEKQTRTENDSMIEREVGNPTKNEEPSGVERGKERHKTEGGQSGKRRSELCQKKESETEDANTVYEIDRGKGKERETKVVSRET